ncbi:ATP-binding protein [Streptomyces sp. SYP-A7185]|uniref:ATP-binding protein n=1 Tax=Streptomyces sp. SYP-A7185 TaxID=3040076 RepID=UPI0038F637FD
MTGRVHGHGGGLMGRAAELAALRRLLAQSRLVTVTGGAGVGKSTLAAHAAAAVGGQLPDGVVIVRWWDGGPARGRSAARAVVDAMDGEAGGGEQGPPPDRGRQRLGERELVARLRERRVLVVLDDFDPVREECVRLVQALLLCAPGVRMLATGRQPLGLGQELVLHLKPLAVGMPGAEDQPGPAVRLFLERAHGVRRRARAEDAWSATTAAPPGGPPRGSSGGSPGESSGGPPGESSVESSGKPPADSPRETQSGAPVEPQADSPRETPGGPPDDPPPPTPDEAELRAVSDICAQLEGVPLAVELAAAQTDRHPPVQLARMLRPTQGWLGRPEAPLRRHRSLRAAVGASYALCGQAERSVWARLSVFTGEFDEDAAVFVCAGGGLDPELVASCLARLVLASVLEPVRDPGGVLQPRYRLPAAARGFGAERLESVGESAAAATRHLTWYRTVASRAHQLWSTGRHEQATLLLRDEEPDLRTALERGPRTADQGATALGMVVDLWFWWAVCGHAAEGREHLRRLLPLGRADTPGCGQALWLAGWLAACTDAPEAEELLGRAWRVAMLSGDDATIGRVAHVQGVIALRNGETERAIEHLREAAHTVPTHADHGPPAAVSWAELAVAQVRVRPADALHSVRRASAGTQTRHDIWTRAMTQYAHALVEHLRGRRSRAWRRAHKALAGVVSVAGPVGTAPVTQLITAIEHGPAFGGVEWAPPCGWDPPGT